MLLTCAAFTLVLAQAELSAMCVWPEVEGLLLVLSALARQPLACCGMQAVPVVYGVQAAYLSSLVTSNKDMLAIMLVAQMLPEEDSEEAPKAAAEGEAEVKDTAEGVGDGNGMSEEGDEDAKKEKGKEGVGEEGKGKQQQAQEAWKQSMRGVVQLVVRCSSHEVLLTLKEHGAAWVHDISQVGFGWLWCSEGFGWFCPTFWTLLYRHMLSSINGCIPKTSRGCSTWLFLGAGSTPLLLWHIRNTMWSCRR